MLPPIVSDAAPDFVKRVTAVMLANKGDLLPVSAFPVDGTWPTATAQWEKRNIAQEIPVWDAAICIQCNKCAMVCPHAAIRAKVYESDVLKDAPATFKGVDFKGNEFKGLKYTIQIAPEDCTGCTLCVVVCPAKDKSNPKHKALDMHPQRPLRDAERENYAFFLDLPEVDRTKVKMDLKGAQFLQPLFEYSGRVRRVRRDAVRQAADPAVRRPGAHRERDGLLVDLRRQPADHARTPSTATAAARPGRTPSSRTTPSSASASGWPSTSTPSRPRNCSEALASQLGDALVDGLLAADQSDRGRHRRAARARGGPAAETGRHRLRTTRAGWSASPTTSSARPCGSSAATAGPTTSATAASTTSWRWAAT